MAIFDYKNLGKEKSLVLFREALDLINYTHKNTDVPAPGWKQLSAEELKYIGVRDERGTYHGENFLVGTAQAEVLGKYDNQGKLVGIGVTFLGTGGPGGLKDYLFDMGNNLMAVFNPDGFGKAYPYLAFNKLLSSVANYAKEHQLTGKDIILAGASLGGMAVNSMADISEQMWGGFYKDSAYVALVSPSQSATQKVLNVGAENDPVFRLMENGKLTSGSLGIHDNLGSSTTDNIISFNEYYLLNLPSWFPYSVANPVSWITHNASGITTYLNRILDSKFYDLTHQDSTIVVSTLSQAAREHIWVENLGRYGATQHGPTFTLGTESNDRLLGSAGTDYLEGGKGDDIFEDRGGYNIVLGGEGHNSMNLLGSVNQYDIAYDNAGKSANDGLGTLYVRDSEGAISILRDIGALNTQDYSYFYGISLGISTVKREVTADGLRTGNSLVAYERSLSGNASENFLLAKFDGEWLFGKGGDDILSSANKNVTLVGGTGNDILISGSGTNNFLFDGDFGNDLILNFGAADKLTFIGVQGAVGDVDYRAFTTEAGDNTVLKFGDSSVTLLGVGLDSLSSSNVVIA